MSRNGSGVYSLPAGYAATTGATATATQHNSPLEDLQADANIPRPVVAGGTGATSASAARTNLGVAIGSNVQAHDAALDSIAALGTGADKGIYATGADTFAEFDLTAAARAFLDDADVSEQRATLGLGSAALMEDSADGDLAVAPDGAARRGLVKAYVDGVVDRTVGYAETAAVLSFDSSGAWAVDNTAPQNTEGTALSALDLTVTKAASAADSALEVEVFINSTLNVGSNATQIAVFRSGIADAVACGTEFITSSGGAASIKKRLAGLDAGSHSFTVRGCNNGNTNYVNGDSSGNAKFAGGMVSFIRVREVPV